MDFPPRFPSDIKRLLAPYPSLFIPAFRIFSPEWKRLLLTSPQTELVIEGFPRSGNTFAVVAFEFAQLRKVSIAHHLHVEAQALEGVRRGIPVMIVVRDPEQAISSLVIRHPKENPNQALRDYVRFYTAIERISKNVLVAEFSQVISKFGDVIHCLNNKFGTQFSGFEHTPENVEKVFKIIESINHKFDQGKETHVARPSQERKSILEHVKLDFAKPLLRDARALYCCLSASDAKSETREQLVPGRP